MVILKVSQAGDHKTETNGNIFTDVDHRNLISLTGSPGQNNNKDSVRFSLKTLPSMVLYKILI